MVWNPHSSLAGCSAGNYALIFAHFAELGHLSSCQGTDFSGNHRNNRELSASAHQFVRFCMDMDTCVISAKELAPELLCFFGRVSSSLDPLSWHG